MESEAGPADLGDIVETLIEAQALLASSIYVDLVNLGVIGTDAAAQRLEALGELAGSPLHRHPQVAAALGERLRNYGEGFARAHSADARRPVELRVLNGGKSR